MTLAGARMLSLKTMPDGAKHTRLGNMKGGNNLNICV